MKHEIKVGDVLNVTKVPEGGNTWVDQFDRVWIEIGEGNGVYLRNGVTGTLNGSTITVDEVDGNGSAIVRPPDRR